MIEEQPIGGRLIQEGFLTKEQVEKAIERQKIYGGRLGTNLVALGFITWDILNSFLTQSPPMPKTIADTGLPQHFIVELILKTILSMGEFTIPDVSSVVKLPTSIVDHAVQLLRRDLFIEVKGAARYARTTYLHTMTSAGRASALELMDKCQYIGPAPVSIDDYSRFVMSQTVKYFEVKEDTVRDAFSHMVINEDIIKRIGPAISSGRSIFLYGPSGNGKTMIAQTIGNIFKGNIYTPYAVYVGGQIITVYDPVNHKAAEETSKKNDVDQRWILIQRPVVIVGAEMDLSMLELNFNAVTKFYEAPLQMKANNGMFVVDDFGRQLINPKDLLNRWIAPLDRRTDYLKLHTGMGFEIPFDQLVIFSTNLDPRELVDEAFMRRIRYKVNIDYPPETDYKNIFIRICEFNKVEFDEDVFKYLMGKYHKTGVKLCAAHPRDLIDQIIDISHYYNTPPVMTKETIDMAWNNFIVEVL